jgi:hypothetical protein
MVGALQATQEPLLQIALLPQRLPFAPGFGPLSVQTGVPEEQEIAPLSQGLLTNGHEAPAVQAPQTPLLQTSLLLSPPQWLPVLAESGPVSEQVWAPVAQENWPLSQGLVGTHVPPAEQGLQEPPLQTLFTPHFVPLPRLSVVSTQTGCPVEQEIPPT